MKLYYTNFVILLVKNMLCCELHCQKVLNLNSVPMKSHTRKLQAAHEAAGEESVGMAELKRVMEETAQAHAEVLPAPCTLHPAPCTLHPAPCTLGC
jgi:hypothetical protein